MSSTTAHLDQCIEVTQTLSKALLSSVLNIFIGASLSEPHINHDNIPRRVEIYVARV